MSSKSLTKEQENAAQPILNVFCYRSARTHEAFKTKLSRPPVSFLPASIRNTLYQHMLSVTRRHELDRLVAEWKYASDKYLDGLFAAICECRAKFKELDEEKKAKKAGKAGKKSGSGRKRSRAEVEEEDGPAPQRRPTRPKRGKSGSSRHEPTMESVHEEREE